MKHYLISEGVFNGIIQNLGSQPYSSVAKLMDAVKADVKEVELKEEEPQPVPETPE